MSDKASLMQQPAPLADVGLQREIAGLFVQALNLEVLPQDIDPEAALYGEGWELDSLDIVGVALIVYKQDGIRLGAGACGNQHSFRTSSNLADYSGAHTT